MWVEVEIAKHGGALSFHDFMELALYHPRHGYYSSGRPRYGRGGDYLTAPTASAWYTAVHRHWLVRLAADLGPLTVVDVASGDGSYLTGLLECETASFLKRAVSVERSDALRALQDERFAGAAEVVSSLQEALPPQGAAVLHLSELYDAMPVHRVVQRDDGLKEMWVAAGGGKLVWQERAARPELGDYLRRHGVSLEDGQIAEIDLHACGFHRRLLRWAGVRAAVLTLDYGYPAVRLYDSRGRRSGSLACYREHRLTRDPLDVPGEQDLTAHVNWDDLRRAAEAEGWHEVGLYPLAELLVRTGLADVVEDRGLGLAAEIDGTTYHARQEIKRLLDPDGMGADLKVLVQATPEVAGAVAETLGNSLPPPTREAGSEE
jgi:SAM-dependent MidA family methyltransferase